MYFKLLIEISLKVKEFDKSYFKMLAYKEVGRTLYERRCQVKNGKNKKILRSRGMETHHSQENC